MASQRHKLTIQNVTAAGEIIAEGAMAPGYVIQIAGEPPAGRSARETGGAVTVPIGPDGGALAGSSLAGPIPETITPPDPALAPTIVSLDPDTAVLGSADFTLRVLGMNYTEQSLIIFAGQEEPIVFVSAEEITTIVKPSLGWGAVTLPVQVINGEDGQTSNEVMFTFTDIAATTAKRRKKVT